MRTKWNHWVKRTCQMQKKLMGIATHHTCALCDNQFHGFTSCNYQQTIPQSSCCMANNSPILYESKEQATPFNKVHMSML